MSLVVNLLASFEENQAQRPMMSPNSIKKSLKRPNALKGNDKIRLMKLCHDFFTKALQSFTDGPTDRPTEGSTDRHTLS